MHWNLQWKELIFKTSQCWWNIYIKRERDADYKLFLKPHSILKPIENDSGNKSTIVKLKNLDKNIRFIIDGCYDFEKKIWMDNKRIIRDDEWFQSKSYYLNYPVMNDRIAFKKGKTILLINIRGVPWDSSKSHRRRFLTRRNMHVILR